jgi:hypothetical protein
MPKRSLPGKAEFSRLNQGIEAMLAPSAGKSAHADAKVAPLLKIVARLRNLPREEFKETLKNNLERSASMATITTTMTEPKAAVRTYASPRLAFRNAGKAMEFYKNAFGAKETMCFENEYGFGHAEMMIGDSVIMFAEECQKEDATAPRPGDIPPSP